MYQRVRRDEGWRAERGLPAVAPAHPPARAWRSRAARFRQARALAAARLGPGPWRVLDAGAGCCWTAIGLLDDGHRVAAVDVNMDAEDGLRGAERVSPRAAAIDRAEAEMEALPVEPASFDLVLAAASLHHVSHLTRTLVELRRVTRRGSLEVHDGPGRARQWARDLQEVVRRGRRAARFPILLARRDG
jgi:ubiquinone/menaquinone biosynthesis C-methylase UbiE